MKCGDVVEVIGYPVPVVLTRKEPPSPFFPNDGEQWRGVRFARGTKDDVIVPVNMIGRTIAEIGWPERETYDTAMADMPTLAETVSGERKYGVRKYRVASEAASG